MNDFTKDELKHIKTVLFYFPVLDLDLIEKVESLIDNCCEHPNKFKDYLGIGCLDCGLRLSEE